MDSCGTFIVDYRRTYQVGKSVLKGPRTAGERGLLVVLGTAVAAQRMSALEELDIAAVAVAEAEVQPAADMSGAREQAMEPDKFAALGLADTRVTVRPVG